MSAPIERFSMYTPWVGIVALTSNPLPSAFYTGNEQEMPPLGKLQNYFEWKWGDAQFIVLDPFCGSGTTIRVAERLQRKGIGLDLGYHELSKQRIKNNQITDSTVNAAAKLQDYSVTAGKLANNITYGSDLTVSGNLTVKASVVSYGTV